MTELNKAGQINSLGHLDTTQRTFREQIDALTDTVRQLGGHPEVPGDPLSAPYVIYVDPNIGVDTFVAGDYTATEDGTYETKMRRISLQRLECGYSVSRPFRTISRAIIEAGIITSRDYLTLGPICGDLVSIVLAPGVTIALNGSGEATTPVWTDGQVPTDAELQAFNPNVAGGLILPRGCSLISMDLRKTIVRPSEVPTPEDEAANYSNRRAIFKMTGGGYYYGFTILDKKDSTESHHLLDAFQYTSEDELDEFYGKIRSSFSGVAGINDAITVPRDSEYQIVGPLTPVPTEAVDTVAGASPYIYNISLRSVLGMCGVFADGNVNEGFRSTVIAQFTGVSLQKTPECWELYTGGVWIPITNYSDYINAKPDNLRMKPARRSFHIRAVNKALIQEVSVFAIGQGVHHWVQNGGELTVTNSNSNFGGCAALGEGYRDKASVNDSGWSVGRLRVATNLAEKANNVRTVFLGKADDSNSNTTTSILLNQKLNEGVFDRDIPRELEKLGYTFRPGSYIWASNSRGPDFYAPLAAVPWDRAFPDVINLAAPFINENGEVPGQAIPDGTDLPDLAGQNIYIRRLSDVRTTNERRYAILGLNLSGTNRTPQRDYILQTDVTAASINSEIPYENTICCASGSKITGGPGGTNGLIELRRLNGDTQWVSEAYYRPGDTVRYQNKHWNCVQTNKDVTFQTDKWVESFVHMESEFNAEDYYKNAQPEILFDNDSDPTADTTNCGYDLTTVWATDPEIQAQYRSATDYRGMFSFLVSLGFVERDAHTILLPRPADDRDRDNSSPLDGISSPSGAANSWAPWSIEFRRPSSIRLFGQAYEWAGFSNYSKGQPQYQQNMSAANKFTYYMTNSVGRVYGSGFNEEGFLVTPQGVQDLQTGQEVTVDGLGAEQPVDEVQFPTSFESLSVNQLTVNTSTVLNGSIVTSPAAWGDGFGSTLPALPNATTEQRGVIEIATEAEALTGTDTERAITPATLAVGLTLAVPVGMVLIWPGSTVPAGYLECDGGVIDAAYTQLRALIGNNTPDLRGQFVRGWDNGAGVDSGRALGSSQGSQNLSHAHGISDPGHAHGVSDPGHAHTYSRSGFNTSNNDPQATNVAEFEYNSTTAAAVTGISIQGAGTNISVSADGGGESRPVNVALMYVIKHD